MGNNKKFFEKLWDLFVSVKFSITIFILLATTSIIGTLIPQNEHSGVYINAYGESLYNILSRLQMFDMYHAWWFMLLEILLVINIIVCSIDRLDKNCKRIFSKTRSFNFSFFLNFKAKKRFNSNKSITEILESYEPFIKKNFSFRDIKNERDECIIYAEKNRWALLGVYIVHLSVVLFLAGALITSIFGFDGYVAIPEGESASSVNIKEGIKKDIGFEVRCDKFELQFYENGSPKEYKSYLTVIENGKEAFKRNIIVNDPLHYKGINIFQSNYGVIAPKGLNISFTNQESGMTYFKDAKIGEHVELPEGMGYFIVRDFTNSYKFGRQNIGEAFFISMKLKDKEEESIIIPVKYKSFDKMRRGYFAVSVNDYEKRYYTGLKVTEDPGVSVIYAGFISMLAGIFITFFIPYKRLCIHMKKVGKTTEVTVSGISGRNKEFGEGLDLPKIF